MSTLDASNNLPSSLSSLSAEGLPIPLRPKRTSSIPTLPTLSSSPLTPEQLRRLELDLTTRLYRETLKDALPQLQAKKAAEAQAPIHASIDLSDRLQALASKLELVAKNTIAPGDETLDEDALLEEKKLRDKQARRDAIVKNFLKRQTSKEDYRAALLNTQMPQIREAEAPGKVQLPPIPQGQSPIKEPPFLMPSLSFRPPLGAASPNAAPPSPKPFKAPSISGSALGDVVGVKLRPLALPPIGQTSKPY